MVSAVNTFDEGLLTLRTPITRSLVLFGTFAICVDLGLRFGPVAAVCGLIGFSLLGVNKTTTGWLTGFARSNLLIADDGYHCAGPANKNEAAHFKTILRKFMAAPKPGLTHHIAKCSEGQTDGIEFDTRSIEQ